MELNKLPFAALPPLQRSIPKGHFSPPPTDCSAGRFALLSEVFDRFPSTAVHLEIKQYTECTPVVKATAKLIQDYNREHITIWGSFSARLFHVILGLRVSSVLYTHICIRSNCLILCLLGCTSPHCLVLQR